MAGYILWFDKKKLNGMVNTKIETERLFVRGGSVFKTTSSNSVSGGAETGGVWHPPHYFIWIHAEAEAWNAAGTRWKQETHTHCSRAAGSCPAQSIFFNYKACVGHNHLCQNPSYNVSLLCPLTHFTVRFHPDKSLLSDTFFNLGCLHFGGAECEVFFFGLMDVWEGRWIKRLGKRKDCMKAKHEN